MVSLITREFHNFEQKLPFKINNKSCKKSFGFVMESTFPTHRWLWFSLLGICQAAQGAKKYPIFPFYCICDQSGHFERIKEGTFKSANKNVCNVYL